MVECHSCKQNLVKTDAPARYDVLVDGVGPYCETCWPNTITGQAQ